MSSWLESKDKETLTYVAAGVVSTMVVLGLAGGTTVVMLLRSMSQSVGLAKPTADMLKEEDPAKNCALFRHLPKLVERLAWRSLGARKTPIHICKLETKDKKAVEFLLKREDLIADDYGGNKVRTLQHQLAVCESRRNAGEKAFQQLVSAGSGGSNQVVATAVHAKKLGWDGRSNDINACWFDKDEPDLDNTLNMLSVLSFQNIGFTHDWASGGLIKMFRAISNAFSQTEMVPMMLGGNCPAGVLGQVGGVLELAEQIAAGECPDPIRIYVPIGSACTVSGLCLGTVLARHLGLKAFASPDFKIVGCDVHDGIALADRLFNFHVNPSWSFMPLTITHTVVNACRALKELGGPDLEKDALAFITSPSLDIRADKDVVGKYGGHSEKSREAARLYDESGIVTDLQSGRKEKQLWVCGHFVSKAVQPMLQDLVELDSDKKVLLWMTKSAVQPRGTVEEWPKLLERNATVRKWADEGKQESKLRPGRVSTTEGKAEDYRSLMTKIQ